MTLPDERYRAIQQTRKFLQSLLDPKLTPRIPRSIRKNAYWCLRHFPADYQIDQIASTSQDIFEKPRK